MEGGGEEDVEENEGSEEEEVEASGEEEEEEGGDVLIAGPDATTTDPDFAFVFSNLWIEPFKDNAGRRFNSVEHFIAERGPSHAYDGLLYKFSQSKPLRTLLLRTGNRRLVDATDRQNNTLGKYLARVRTQLWQVGESASVVELDELGDEVTPRLPARR